MSSDLLFLLSRGPSSVGIVKILHSDKVVDVAIAVTVEYHEQEAINRVFQN
jgi:hypothetical protein